jgi:hypothetical protein
MKGEPKMRPSMWRDGRVMRNVSGSAEEGTGTVSTAWPICLTLIVLEKDAFWALYPSSRTPLGRFVMLYAVAGG